MGDPQVETILAQARALPGANSQSLEPIAGRRAYAEGRAAQQPPRPDVAESWEVGIPGPHGSIPVRFIRPVGAPADSTLPILIYFHGGGWVFGDIETHDILCRLLANKSGVCVASVGYRLSPEYKFPIAVDESYAAIEWVAAQADALRIDRQKIAVGGDSAGAGLATVAALVARDRGGPPLRFQMLIYPLVDLRAEFHSRSDFAAGFLLDSDVLEWLVAQYVRGPADLDDWRTSPLRAPSLRSLPPAFVLTAELDPLRDEGKAYADALRVAGVEATYHCFEGMVHGFCNMSGVIDEALRAHDLLALALKTALE